MRIFVAGSWPARCGLWIICWCYLLVSCVTARKRMYSDDSLLRTQCKARCLKKYVMDGLLKGVNDSLWRQHSYKLKGAPYGILQSCRMQKNPRIDCYKCLEKGCEAKIHTLGDCRGLCEGNFYCEFGCETLRSLVRKKSGQCPKLKQDSTCYNQCRTDVDCGLALHKCCQQGCGTACVAPKPTALMVPEIKPNEIHIFESQERKFELDWKYLNDSNFRNPVLFLVQISIYTGETFRWRYASKWEQLTYTTTRSMILDDLRIGVWYRFRIAAVSADGTRGFGANTPPLRLSERPQPPTAPRNVTDGTWRIHASGSINVEITWSPPLRSDLPLTAYSIQWVKDLGYVQSDGRSLEGFTKFKKRVPPDTLKYNIENLESDTSYKVQVVAWAKWGEKVLKSQANTLFITAPTLRTSGHNENGVTAKDPSILGEGCRCGRDSASYTLTDKKQRLHIYKPEYEKGSLNLRILLLAIRRGEDIPYAVEWKPEVCIAAESKAERLHGPTRGTMKTRLFKIQGLSFNCRYSLLLTPLDSGSKNPGVIRSCFCTPSCRDVKLADPAFRPRCLVDDSPPLPLKPATIGSRLLDRKALNYLLRWQPPMHSPPFDKYRVMWGPREKEPVNKDMYGDKYGLSPKLDFQFTEIKVVPKNITSLVLKNLKRATLYIAKVQTLAYNNRKESESVEAVHYFTTEGFINPVGIYETHGIVSKYIKPHNGASSIATAIPLWTMLCSSLAALRTLTRSLLAT